MLGYSVSYFLSQYWRNVPLYAEKLIPLLDTVLSGNFVFSDKVAGAFYELINKYQNTDLLPLENLKEFIREQGYGYVLDLMIQDEENVKLLWYLLILIHQLKGSKEGLELVLSLFQGNNITDKVSLLKTLGEPNVIYSGRFLPDLGPELLTDKIKFNGACPNASKGYFQYNLPETSYITDVGNYTIQWTNLSYESLGKFNTMKITALLASGFTKVVYNNENLIYTYPPKVNKSSFIFDGVNDAITGFLFEYTCDFYNKKGACISNIKVSRGDEIFIPVEGGTVVSDGYFYIQQEADKAFIENPNVLTATALVDSGSINLIYPTSLEAGTYVLNWDLLSADVACYIKSLKISIRYTDWDRLDRFNIKNTLEVYTNDDLNYLMTNKEFSTSFRALKPFNQILISYEMSDPSINKNTAKAYISNLDIRQDTNILVERTIPSMTSTYTPAGSVVTNQDFVEDHEAFKTFNYTSILGATPKADGYVKYSYEVKDRPVAGDYTFTWTNLSTDNNSYLTSVKAIITYINDSTQTVCVEQDLKPVTSKTQYSYKFTALNTIKDVTFYYTCKYKDGIGGTFNEVNIIRTKEIENGSNISVWHESLPVSTENTFEITSEIDIAKAGKEFFYNFRNFVRNYVYPELMRLKVKFDLEGAQTQMIYNQTKIDYNSTINPTIDKLITIVPTPSDANVVFNYYGREVKDDHMYVIQDTPVTYTISKKHFNTLTETVTVTDDITIEKSLVELPKYTITFNPVDTITLEPIENVTYELISDDVTSTTNSIDVYEGNSVTYKISNEDYKIAEGSLTPTETEEITIFMTPYLDIETMEGMDIEDIEEINIEDLKD